MLDCQPSHWKQSDAAKDICFRPEQFFREARRFDMHGKSTRILCVVALEGAPEGRKRS